VIDIKKLEDIAFHIRKDMLEMCINSKTGHLTSSLSCVDILVALYYGGIINHDPKNPNWDGRDRFILSKGQASPALYVLLGNLGYFEEKELCNFAKYGGMFGVHLQKTVPGVELTTGSLGHGFNVSVGMALALKKDRKLNFVYSILGDGECHEGSIWEAAMFASHNNLNNIIAIIDRNYLCATDFTENCVSIEPLVDRWESFGWDVTRINGNNMEEVMKSLYFMKFRRNLKPKVIIADTIKGNGIEYIHNIPLWHSRAPSGNDIEKCRKGLCDFYGK